MLSQFFHLDHLFALFVSQCSHLLQILIEWNNFIVESFLDDRDCIFQCIILRQNRHNFFWELVSWGNKVRNSLRIQVLNVKISSLILQFLEVCVLFLQVFECGWLNGLCICNVSYVCIDLVICIAQMSFQVDQIVKWWFCTHSYVTTKDIDFFQKLTLFWIFNYTRNRKFWLSHLLLLWHSSILRLTAHVRIVLSILRILLLLICWVLSHLLRYLSLSLIHCISPLWHPIRFYWRIRLNDRLYETHQI